MLAECAIDGGLLRGDRDRQTARGRDVGDGGRGRPLSERIANSVDCGIVPKTQPRAQAGRMVRVVPRGCGSIRPTFARNLSTRTRQGEPRR